MKTSDDLAQVAATKEYAKWASALRMSPVHTKPTIHPKPIHESESISDLVVGEFKIGIEFEGLVRHEIYDDFVESFTNLSIRKSGEPNISFGHDDSIKEIPNGFIGVEIRTEALRYSIAISLFERMLCFLYIASQTDDFRTNKYCGLHMNVSEKNIFGQDRQIDFYCHVLKHFDEMSILTTFNRVGNKYCLPFFKATDHRTIESILHSYNECKKREKIAKQNGQDRASRESKYFSVSLRDSSVHDDYEGEKEKNQRIEFRCLGNVEYHLRFEELDSSINHMLSCIKKAYKSVAI